MTGRPVSAPVVVPLIVRAWPCSAASTMSSPATVLIAMVGAVVSTCSTPAGFVTTPDSSALSPPVPRTVAPFSWTAATARSEVFSPAATV